MEHELTTISDQLREAIHQSGITRYRLARLSGVAESQLSRFVNGRSGLTLDAADKLGGVLGVRLVVRKPRIKTR